MNFEDQLDYTIACLYARTKDKTVKFMQSIANAFGEQEISISPSEIKEIQARLALDKLAVFQVQMHGQDYKGQITDKGVEFVERTSYGRPGTPVREMMGSAQSE